MIEHIKPNCSLVRVGNVEVLYSYSTPIAIREGDRVLVSSQRFSTTTTRHTNLYLQRVKGCTIERVAHSDLLLHLTAVGSLALAH